MSFLQENFLLSIWTTNTNQVASFILAAALATFSRFIPSVKTRFDYGASIFILTFSLVSVSGYRVEKLIELAQTRLSTIAIGTSLCILTSMLFCPIWAGNELHSLITHNLEKLSDSLHGKCKCLSLTSIQIHIQVQMLITNKYTNTGCIAEYFHQNETEVSGGEDCSKKLQGYKCVLNSKGTEDSMVGS